ncbi:hypothetical protein GW17_00034540 [Ensete ventricosum]|nr:hypothetical protein GW17_00034540 [Ensete ventricosum]
MPKRTELYQHTIPYRPNLGTPLTINKVFNFELYRPYRAIRISLPTDRYVDCLLSGGMHDIAPYWRYEAVSGGNSRRRLWPLMSSLNAADEVTRRRGGGDVVEVRNTRTVNRTGLPAGYKLMPGPNCLPLAGPEAKFLRRAAFLKHNLWVTSYKHDEMYPGGEFPNQNPRINEGLATWVKKNRCLEETNIVLWSLIAFRSHIPIVRLEASVATPDLDTGPTLLPTATGLGVSWT